MKPQTIPKLIQRLLVKKNAKWIDKIKNQYRYIGKIMDFQSIKIKEFYHELSTSQIKKNFRNSMKIVILYWCGTMLLDDILYPTKTSTLTISILFVLFSIVCYCTTIFLDSIRQISLLNVFVICGMFGSNFFSIICTSGLFETNFTPSIQLTVLMFSYLPMKLNNALILWMFSYGIIILCIIESIRYKEELRDVWSPLYNPTNSENIRQVPLFDERTNLNQLIFAFIFFGIGITMTSMYLYFVNHFHSRSAFVKLGHIIQAKSLTRSAIKTQHQWLDSIMPKVTKEEYLQGKEIIRCKDWLYIKKFHKVSILFADLVGFTTLSFNKSASLVVALLNDLFNRFNELCSINKCEKVSTLGDGFYCVAGCPIPMKDHVKACIDMGLGMCRMVEQFNEDFQEKVNVQIGIHTGQVIAAIIGKTKFRFDLYSNEVTIAKIMESSGQPGRIHISETVYVEVRQLFVFQKGQNLKIKTIKHHKNGTKTELISRMNTYFIVEKTFTQPIKRSLSKIDDLKIFTILSKSYSSFSGNSYMDMALELPQLPDFDKDAYRNMIKIDIEFLESIQFDPDKKLNIIINPPIQLFSMRFIDKEIEWHFQTCGTNYGNDQDLDILKLNPFLDGLVCFLYSLIIYISFFILFPEISWKGKFVIWMNILISIFILLIMTWPYFEFKFHLQTINPSLVNIFNSNQYVRIFICLQFLSTPFVVSYVLRNCTKLYVDYFYTIRYFSLVIFSLYIIPLFLSVDYFVKIFICLVYGVIEFSFFIKGPCGYVHLSYTYPHYSCFGQINITDATYYQAVTYNFIFQIFMTCVLMIFIFREIERNIRVLFLMTRELEIHDSEATRSMAIAQELLNNIIPNYVIDRLNVLPKNRKELTSFNYAVHIPDAAVTFVSISSYFFPKDIKKGKHYLEFLHKVICCFDDILDKDIYKDIEKIKTINNSYIVASGLNLKEIDKNPQKNQHLKSLMYCAFDMMKTFDWIKKQCLNNSEMINIKIGYNIGPLTAGIIGKLKPLYDIWGTTVNMSHRMCSTGPNGGIHVSFNAKQELESEFLFKSYRTLLIKNKETTTYICTSPLEDEIENECLSHFKALSISTFRTTIFDKKPKKHNTKKSRTHSSNSKISGVLSMKKISNYRKARLSLRQSQVRNSDYTFVGFTFN